MKIFNFIACVGLDELRCKSASGHQSSMNTFRQGAKGDTIQIVFNHLRRIQVQLGFLMLAVILSGVSYGQSDLNKLIVSEYINGEYHIYIDHNALNAFGDSSISSLNPDGDGTWNTWKDVLTNGNYPGMDVNFAGNTAYGIDSLLVQGGAELDSTLQVDGFVTLNDSLTVMLFSYFQSKVRIQDSLIVVGSVDLDSDLDVDGTTNLDSLHVAENADFDQDVNIDGNSQTDGNANIDGNLDVDGTTNLDNTDIDGTLDVDGDTELDTVNVAGSLTVAGTSDLNSSLDVQGTTNLQSTLTVAGSANLNGGLKMANGTQGNGYFMVSDANGNASWQSVSASVTVHSETITMRGASNPITKPTAMLRDEITLTDDGSGWCTVDMGYAFLNPAGAAGGTGETRIFQLPAGYQFDLNYHMVSTAANPLTLENGWSYGGLAAALAGSDGYIINNNPGSPHWNEIYVVPLNATEFRIGTAGASAFNWVYIGNNWAMTDPHNFYVSFRFKKN